MNNIVYGDKVVNDKGVVKEIYVLLEDTFVAEDGSVNLLSEWRIYNEGG